MCSRTILKVSSADFSGADYVPERSEDRRNVRAVWEWACSHGRMVVLLVCLGLGMSVVEHSMTAAIDAVLGTRARLLALLGPGRAVLQLLVFVLFTTTLAVAGR